MNQTMTLVLICHFRKTLIEMHLGRGKKWPSKHQRMIKPQISMIHGHGQLSWKCELPKYLKNLILHLLKLQSSDVHI